MSDAMRFPYRFFGPVPAGEAETVVETTLDDEQLRDTLERFARGEISVRDLAYEVQVLLQGNMARLMSREPDAMDARKDRP